MRVLIILSFLTLRAAIIKRFFCDIDSVINFISSIFKFNENFHLKTLFRNSYHSHTKTTETMPKPSRNLESRQHCILIQRIKSRLVVYGNRSRRRISKHSKHFIVLLKFKHRVFRRFDSLIFTNYKIKGLKLKWH